MDLVNLEKLLESKQQAFSLYADLLLKWNKTYNLTAIKDKDDIRIKHFLDSAAPLPFLPKKGRLLDAGSGAGFPGIPLKILSPDLSITLLEATGKKCKFCDAVIRDLGLKGIETFCGRIEDERTKERLGKFDAVISRATWPIAKFAANCRDYLKGKDSILISMKGPSIEMELEEAEAIILNEGMKITKTESYTLPDEKGARNLVIISLR